MNNEQVKELSGIAKEVKKILERDFESRDDNWALVFHYAYKHTDLKMLIKDDAFLPFPVGVERFLNELTKINIESVLRAKRKVQELYPELRGEKRKERERRQELFIEFNRQRKKDLEDFWEADVEVGEDED